MLARKRIVPLSTEAERPKVTPDPARADELKRRQEALRYYPAGGFLRDKVQRRRDGA